MIKYQMCSSKYWNEKTLAYANKLILRGMNDLYTNTKQFRNIKMNRIKELILYLNDYKFLKKAKYEY